MNGNSTPVIMITARNELVDKVVGLELGANDYMTKPFEPRELLARIGVHLRLKNNEKVSNQKLSDRGVELDIENYKVTYNGSEKRLTNKEFDLLKFFMENPNKVFARDELLNQVWGLDQFIETRTVDGHVVTLRKKFFESCIETVRGIGYRWSAPSH